MGDISNLVKYAAFCTNFKSLTKTKLLSSDDLKLVGIKQTSRNLYFAMLFSEMKCTYLCQFDPPALYKCPIVFQEIYNKKTIKVKDLEWTVDGSDV